MPTSSFNQYFPGYEILGELGRSNARVLKARNITADELVAIKHYSFNTDAQTLQRFQRESEIMTAIDHPNVVKVREVHLDAELPYLVMDWIEGGDLRSLLKSKKLDVSTTLRLGLQMAEAFKSIHYQAVIHRDIKPENILYRLLPSGELHFLLTDFGISKLREQNITVTGQSLMTYEYASPEQFDNPRGVVEATDYYSLGVVLYECILGRVPFEWHDGVGIGTFSHRVMNEKPPKLPFSPDLLLPDSLNSLLQLLLEKNPPDRLSDVRRMERLLKKAELEHLGPDPDQDIAKEKVTKPGGSVEQKKLEANEKPSRPNPPAHTANKFPRRQFWAVGGGLFLSGFGIWYFSDQAGSASEFEPADSTAVTEPDAQSQALAPVKKPYIELDEYSEIREFEESRAVVRKGPQYGFIDKSGKLVIPCQFDFANNFSDGLAGVQKGGKWGTIDRSGKPVISCQYDNVGALSEGLRFVKKGGKYGYIDKAGTVVISFQFDDADSFSEGMAVVKKDGNYGCIDKAGTVVIPFEFEGTHPFAKGKLFFQDGMACVKKGNKYGCIDMIGKLVIPYEFDHQILFQEGLALVLIDHKWGYIDKTGTLVIPYQFDDADLFTEGLANVKKDGRFGYIDKAGILVIPYQFDDAGDFSEGMACVKKGNKFGTINTTGKLVIPCQFDTYYYFTDGLAVVKKDGKFGYVNQAGKLVIPCQFDETYGFREGLAKVVKANKHGFIDESGQLVIPYQFDTAEHFSEGLSNVKKDGIKGYINKTGQWVMQCSTSPS